MRDYYWVNFFGTLCNLNWARLNNLCWWRKWSEKLTFAEKGCHVSSFCPNLIIQLFLKVFPKVSSKYVQRNRIWCVSVPPIETSSSSPSVVIWYRTWLRKKFWVLSRKDRWYCPAHSKYLSCCYFYRKKR